MATIEWCCSFDHLATADLALEYTVSSSPAIAATGRFGTNAVQGSAWSEGLTRSCTAAATKCSGALVTVDPLAAAIIILAFFDTGTKHVDLRMRSNGALFVTRNGTQLGSDSAPVLMAGVPAWIEMKAFINDSTGTIEVRVNGTAVINLTGQDTRNGATAQVNQVRWFGETGGSGIEWDVDDWCISDDFLGDTRVAWLSPTAEGTTIQLTPSTGTDNSALVDEDAQNGDTDYVEHATDNNKDTYVMENLPSAAATVHGVQLVHVAKKDDAGAKSIAQIARTSGGTEADSADKALSTSYALYLDMRTTKPGGGAWSSSDVDGMEVGQKVRP